MILVADLGTGSLKAAIISPEGEMLSRVRIPYSNPPGLRGNEFDALEWEQAFLTALKKLPSVKLSCIALSGNGPTLVPCNASGKPLSPALIWFADQSLKREDQDSYYLPKAAWFHTHCPEIWKNTHWLLSCPEWLQFRLCGTASMTLPHKTFGPYLWDEQQLEAYDIPSELFPEMIDMGELAGRVSAEASAQFGVPEGVPIAAVGSDFMAALLGSGTIKEGMVCDRAGTSEGINYCAAQPSGDARLRDLPHVVEGLWNISAVLSSTGLVFDWYRRLTGEESRPFAETLAAVDALEPGGKAPLFFPGAKGEVLWEFERGSFHRLEPGHGPAHMGRAVMEAIGFAVRRGIDIIESAGFPVEQMRICGGQARSAVWNQMKADITGKELLIPAIEDAELAGSAACAVAALGLAEHPIDASFRFVRIRSVFQPQDKIHRVYNDAYRRYREIFQSL